MKLRYLLPLIAIALNSCAAPSLGEKLGGKLADSIPQKHSVPPTESWKVVKIADGDTITVQRGSQKERIRFCGIDAVEKQQKLGPQAKEYLRSLISKGDGTVMVSPIEKDRYGRTVAELFVKPRLGTPGYQPEEEIFLNGEMVRAGYARHYSRYSGNCSNREVIEKSEVIAKQNRVGVWSDPNAVAPWEFRKLQRQNRGN